MSQIIYWGISAKYCGNRLLTNEERADLARRIIEKEHPSEHWIEKHDPEHVVDMETTSFHSYKDVLDHMTDLTIEYPGLMFCAISHCAEYEEYIRTHVFDGEIEEMRGYVAYPEPQRIKYE